MSGRETYDLSRKELEVIQYRDARRRAMRAAYQNYVYSPYPKGEFFDENLFRWNALRTRHRLVIKRNVKSFLLWVGVLLLPLNICHRIVQSERKPRLAAIRKGEVAYKDRIFKFT